MGNHKAFEERARKLSIAAAALKEQCAIGKTGRSEPAFSLAFFTDNARLTETQTLSIARALPLGAALVYRNYAQNDRAAFGKRLRGICLDQGVLFLAAGDIDLAQRLDADGLHAPSWLINSPTKIDFDGIVSAACHNEAELGQAADAGCDIAFLSPVFQTESHAEVVGLGPVRAKEVAEKSTLPVLALGGVNDQNAGQLTGGAFNGFGAIGAFLPQ